MAPDPDTLDVNPWILRGQLSHAGHLIRQRVVAHIAVVEVVKLLGPQGVAHPLDLHDHESKLSQRLAIAARTRERPAVNASALGARINIVDDRILLPAVQTGWLEHQPV